MRILTDTENGEMMDTLCDEEAQKKGYNNYFDLYIHGDPEECYEMVRNVERSVYQK